MLGEGFNRSGLKHTGADAAEDVFAGSTLQNYALDADILQHPGQQEPGRPGTDDNDLRLHRMIGPASLAAGPVLDSVSPLEHAHVAAIGGQHGALVARIEHQFVRMNEDEGV